MTSLNVDSDNIIQAGYKDSTPLFRWNITDICQYKCEYCYSNNDERIKFCNYKIFIMKLKQLTKGFRVELIGGEPTLHPDIYNIIKELSFMNTCLEITLITNLEKDINFFIDLFSITKKLVIDCSYHSAYSKNFYNKVILLENYNTTVTVNLDPNPKTFNKTVKMIDDLMKTNLILDLNFLKDNLQWTNKHGNETVKKYIERYQDFFKKIVQIPHTIKDDQNAFSEVSFSNLEINNNVTYKNMLCTPLLFVIDIDGKVKNCCTKKIFNMIKDNNIFQDYLCDYDKCNCDEKHIFYKRINDDI